jgi:excisionase family DNA binding protein
MADMDGLSDTNSLLGAAAVAHYLGVSARTVERQARRGELPSVKVGRSRRYDLGQIRRVLEARGREGGRA